MPQITVKGLTDQQMKEISTPLVQKLAEAIGNIQISLLCHREKGH